MASSFAPNMQPMYRSGALTVDTKHAQRFFDEDDNGILDENILDSSALDSGLELSPPMVGSRRESFVVGGPSLFSPKTEDWQSVDMQSVPSNNPFVDNTSNNPFMRLEQNATPALGQQNGWTTFANYDGFTDYDANASVFRVPAQTPFSHPGNMFASLGSSNQSIPTSPHKEYMSSNQSTGKKTRPESPAIRSHNELRRGDGIRKKNARFEIPAERNLSNIDQLIAQSTDETEVKELKQQKRLLRNRQAALDSRQRKKQHTERLEDEKKQFTTIITDMEQEITDLKVKMDQLLREKQNCMDYVETVTLERDELIRTHTNETGELRKKVAVLTDHVQRLESNAPHTGSNTFNGSYGDMEDLTMGTTWDNGNNGFLNDYSAEPEIKEDRSLVPVKKSDNALADGDKSASQQGGFLFMLFLVGAFVLSSRSTPAIPRVSEDVRAASATLLDNVLKDAGVAQASQLEPMAPQPSGTWQNPGNSVPMGGDMNVDNVAPSMLGELGDSLTQPTQEQTNEQIFSLSAAQYNGVQSQDFLQNGNTQSRFTSQGRRNLADALSAIRMTTKQNGAADVYTRSLLWDQIPSEVVRDFAKMVTECNNAQNDQQQCNEAIS